MIHPPELSGSRHLVAKLGGTWQKMALNFAYEVSLSIPVGFLTCRKTLRHGTDGFTPPSKYGLLSPLKNPSSSAGSEPANLESNGKHDNHYTTEGDKINIIL
jgi:hypothetical protein